jgi:hypothetical protein
MKKEIEYKGYKIIVEILFKQNVSLSSVLNATMWGLRHKIIVSVVGTDYIDSNILLTSSTPEEILSNCILLENKAKEFIDSKNNSKEFISFFINNGFTIV